MDQQKLVNLNSIQAKTIIKTIEKLGVINFHSSPGLRNAPLLNAIADNSKLNLTSHFDERATAYRALAQAKITGNPTAILCTSGTALINFYPAIVEAYFQEIPLIVISSDRPQHLIKGLANQCIYQDDIFDKYTCSSIQIEEPSKNTKLKNIVKLIIQNIDTALSKKQPTHINIAFLDPANKLENSVPESEASDLVNEFQSLDYDFQSSTQTILESLKEINLNNIKKPDLIAIGELPINTSNETKECIKNLLKQFKVPFTADITSQIKYDLQGETYLIPSVDHPEVKQWLSNQEIQTVWHIGGRFTSKHFYQLLKNKNVQILEFSNTLHNFNPSLCSRTQYQLSTTTLNKLIELNGETKATPNFKQIISSKRKVIEDNPLSFPLISKKIIENYINSDDILVLANSTCIRSFDFFAALERAENPQIYCHRGASGIEGFLASIKGISESLIDNSKRIVAILGDITALHDFNSLFLFNQEVAANIDIFIVNDQGGGIFRLLSVPEMANCKTQMETPHEISFTSVLQSIFKENQHVAVKRISNKTDFLDTINSPSVIDSPKINFYEIVLNQS
jgi:2-succinyl-5-enolpyruvyl-6-hydroxy-3-cyclohexene-1-carboxylate synthase